MPSVGGSAAVVMAAAPPSCEVIETNGTTTAKAKEMAKDVGIKVGLSLGAAAMKSLLESK